MWLYESADRPQNHETANEPHDLTPDFRRM
jgi:hypothetical protein